MPTKEEIVRGEIAKTQAEVDDDMAYDGIYYLKDEETLEKIGVHKYHAAGGENGKAKTHEIDIIAPNPKDGSFYGLPLFIHFNVGPTNSAVLCPVFMKKQFMKLGMDVPEEYENAACPVCEEGEKIRVRAMELDSAGGDEETIKGMWNQVKAHRPYKGSYRNPYPMCHLIWMRDASSEEAEDKFKYFYLAPKTVYQDGILEKTVDRNNDFVDLSAKSGGYVFIFKREGTGKDDTHYKGFDIVQREYDIPDEWMDVPRYSEILNFHSYDEIADVMEKTKTEKPSDNVEKAFQPEEKSEEKSEEKTEGGDGRRRRRRRTTNDVQEDKERVEARHDRIPMEDDDIPF